MNKRILAVGSVASLASFGVGILLLYYADSMTVSERLASYGEFIDAATACFVLAAVSAYVALYGLVVRPKSSVPSPGSGSASVGRRGTMVLGLGLIPLSGFLLFLGLGLTEGEGLGQPAGSTALLAGFVLLTAGITITVMGAASSPEKG